MKKLDASLLGSGSAPEAEPSSEDATEAASGDFDSAAQDLYDALEDKDVEGCKAALRNAIEAILDEREKE